MKVLLGLGIVLLLLGVASLFVPIPQRERHGVEVGRVSLGVEMTNRETVHPAISALMIGGGIALVLVGRRSGR